MSTRSTTHFIDGDKNDPVAIIYRHSDGYPSVAGTDILRFFADVKANAEDTRFSDPTYLAAKYVVWLADKFARTWDRNPETGEFEETPNHKLDFISVGVAREDPCDIEYRYYVDCSRMVDGHPELSCYKVKEEGAWGTAAFRLVDGVRRAIPQP